VINRFFEFNSEELTNPPTDYNFLRVTIYFLWHDLPQLLLGGVIFGLICLPSITYISSGNLPLGFVLIIFFVAPVWACLIHFENNLLNGDQNSLRTISRNFLKFWFRSSFLGFWLMLPLIVIAWLVSGQIQVSDDVVLVEIIMCVLVEINLLALYIYVFPLIVFYDQNILKAMRNAIVLSGHYFLYTLGVFMLFVLFILLFVFVNFGFLFVLPAIGCLFMINNARLLIAKYKAIE
jgi:uncharacterized membrane protein YesL